MDFIEKLKHYAEGDNIQDDELLDEAIATLENFFANMGEKELLHQNRPMAIAYLALKHIKKTTN